MLQLCKGMLVDNIDIEIIKILEQDGRITHEEIAKTLHMTRPAIHRRIENLETEGIITGYKALIDWRKVKPCIRCLIFLKINAFTGAIDSRIGKFEQANFGTLFLDEIGDLPIATQGKLLRAIESRKIERLGSNKSINLDVKFISATNKDLEKQILKGVFRDDLLYRINTLTLYIPPLRKRREDLPALIKFFIKKIEIEQKKKIKRVDDDVMDFLLHYDYPGNIRELKNITERMIALSKDGLITINEILMPVGDVIEKNTTEQIGVKALKKARSNFECDFILKALKNNEGNVVRTAKELNISTRQLWNKISEYKIDCKKCE